MRISFPWGDESSAVTRVAPMTHGAICRHYPDRYGFSCTQLIASAEKLCAALQCGRMLISLRRSAPV